MSAAFRLPGEDEVAVVRSVVQQTGLTTQTVQQTQVDGVWRKHRGRAIRAACRTIFFEELDLLRRVVRGEEVGEEDVVTHKGDVVTIRKFPETRDRLQAMAILGKFGVVEKDDVDSQPEGQRKFDFSKLTTQQLQQLERIMASVEIVEDEVSAEEVA